MELIAAELASNAIRHTLSGQDGGEFTLTVRAEPGWARLEVSDAGTGEWNGPRDAADDDECGSGLAIVAALADKLGHDVPRQRADHVGRDRLVSRWRLRFPWGYATDPKYQQERQREGWQA